MTSVPFKMAGQRRSLMQSEQQQSWTDDLPACRLCGVGTATNCTYGPDGKGIEEHANEDGYLRFRGDNGCFLYGVFNGHEGNRVANFVSQRLAAELLLGQLSSSHTDADVRKVLLQAFDVVERSFFESIDDALAERANLLSQLPEGVPLHQLPPQYQKTAEGISILEREISGGATAMVALILNNKLYIANVGTNRALLCKSSSDGQNQVIQIGMGHTTENEDELFRLAQLGLDSAQIKQAGLIGGQNSTRRIGDYRVKYSYSDIDLLRPAKSKPIIAEPEIHGGQSLQGVTGFLLLMSDGLYRALETAHGPEQANQEIVSIVAAECAQQNSLDAVAQAVVDRVRKVHHETYLSGRERAKFCTRHEDMTLLVRTFNYQLGGEASDPALTPTQGTMMNGSHTNSTLDEITPTLTNQSPTATLQSNNTQTQSSSSSSGDGSLFRHRGSQALQPDENGRVEPYVDFSEFYRLWSNEHQDASAIVLGPQ
ncbi:TGF-beta-activated kinase 1 and MAP3K7-binding protein 1 isoform X2 [Polypterus senegalus]|uniref:TGF-beta-activated kinase 1 and MAP3K7-binding protein 1 isoform X2 n=1 Tax=Polypterus senegalus TaxID=55291 RepID=UPI0019659623|nr:TGF-beta-activated kinase 1 and MAP3K7-binding protein 1 isoform X2 [Polypterus senegalus]